jgi:hypothetical protein
LLLSLITSSSFAAVRRIRSGAKLDHQLAVEGCGNARKGVDSGWPRTPLQPRNRGLRRPTELGQFTLGDAPGFPSLRDPFRNQAEQLLIIRISRTAYSLAKRREAVVEAAR